jgi:ABC-type bacteriocin/lantibiotic exporter with double-glycine peptidase domain
MVAKYYGRTISLDYLRNKSQYGKEGVSMLGLADAAESIGLKAKGAKHNIEQLIKDTSLSIIVQKENSIPKSKVSVYRIKNLTIASILTIDKTVLLKTNTNIHLIISALLSAISAFEAKFLYNSSRREAISCVTICCLFSTLLFISSLTRATNCSASFSPNLAFTRLYNLISEMFNASAIFQIYAFKVK